MLGVRGATFDGDADRLVYCNLDAQESFKLLDCDKIATRGCISGHLGDVIYTHALYFSFATGYIQKLIKESGVNLKVGLAQIAYANGSSTDYINNTLVTLNAILFISSLSLCKMLRTGC